MFDVAFGDVRVERILWDVFQFRAAELFDQRLTLFDNVGVIVVVLVARNTNPFFLDIGNRVIHFELQFAKRLCFKAEFDFVFAFGQRGQLSLDGDGRTQRKRKWSRRRNLRGGENASVVEQQLQRIEWQFFSINGNFSNANQFHIAQPILYRELHSAVRISQTAERV